MINMNNDYYRSKGLIFRRRICFSAKEINYTMQFTLNYGKSVSVALEV